MPKVTTAHTFSETFGLDPTALESCGVLDVSLNFDTKLFIDPYLLEQSAHPEISKGAVAEFRTYFSRVLTLLTMSSTNETAARNARRWLTFREAPGTCLGYGRSGTRGADWARVRTEQVLKTSHELVALGATDPDLFRIIPLLEEGVGADYISDMATNVILESLLAFNARVLDSLSVSALEKFEFRHMAGRLSAMLPTNPHATKKTPIILVPRDVLRELPVADDWDTVGLAASFNNEVRERVSRLIGEIWNRKGSANRAEYRRRAKSSLEALRAIMDAAESVPKKHYDYAGDRCGYLSWAKSEKLAQDFPLSLAQPQTIDEIVSVVRAIVEHFASLIEDNGAWKDLYEPSGNPRHESSAQRLFFAVASSYCRANDLDLSPESDSGVGPVDFKMSSGFFKRVLVEIKLSTNTRAVSGYQKQVDAYKTAESTAHAFYVVIDVGRMGKKEKALRKIRNDQGTNATALIFVDGLPQESASKR